MEGDKKYDREFLMALRDLPPARVKPANIPDNLEYSEVARQVSIFQLNYSYIELIIDFDCNVSISFQRALDNRENRYGNMMGKDFMAPAFMPFGGKNSSMKGSVSIQIAFHKTTIIEICK